MDEIKEDFLESKMKAKIDSINERIDALQAQLDAHKKVVKNTLRFSIIIGLVAIFFIALNFSILLTLAGGIAGSDKKINSLQNRLQYLESTKGKDSNNL